MSKRIRITISDAYVEVLRKVAMEDGHYNGTTADIAVVVKTAVRKYLNRRGFPNEEIDRPDQNMV